MKLQNWLTRVMAGRYGSDRLSRALYVVTLAGMLLSLLLRGSLFGNLFWVLGLAALCWNIYRTFSRDHARRRAENERWLKRSAKLFGGLRGAIGRYRQRKDYRFFRCPSCRTWLRVPRGRGKLSITCRQCGERFTRET